jgi:hypothetical protein
MTGSETTTEGRLERPERRGGWNHFESSKRTKNRELITSFDDIWSKSYQTQCEHDGEEPAAKGDHAENF